VVVCLLQFGALKISLHPATAAVRIGSVLSSKSLTASIHSAFCTVVGTHLSNEVRFLTVTGCSFYFVNDNCSVQQQLILLLLSSRPELAGPGSDDAISVCLVPQISIHRS